MRGLACFLALVAIVAGLLLNWLADALNAALSAVILGF